MAIAVGTKAPDFNLKSKQASGIVDVKLSNIEFLIANKPDEFNAHLKAIFSLDKTKKLIASLLAQSMP